MSRSALRCAARRGAAPTIALALLAGACSDGAGDLDIAACDAYAAVSGAFFGDPAELPGLLDDLEAAVPDGLRDATDTWTAGLAASFEGDEEALTAPDFLEASTELGDAVHDDCGTATSLDVAGVDYGFDGLPEEVPAGRVAIRFTNATESGEAHEILVARKAPGTTESLAELLALGEEAFSKVIPVAVAFSDEAGGEATTLVDLEAGDYIAICMIPAADDGAPHAAHGMATEFTVA